MKLAIVTDAWSPQVNGVAAAYPVTGPIDVVREGITGCLREDLASAAREASRLARADCRAAALERTWERATRRFISYLVRADGGGRIVEELE